MFQAKALFTSAGSTVSGNVSDPLVVSHVLESPCEVPGAAALFFESCIRYSEIGL